MIPFILSVTLYIVTTSTRHLLQQQTLGSYGQTCVPPSSDFLCTMPGQTLTDGGSGSLECGLNYGCCMCQTIICGGPQSYCDTFQAGGEYSVFGVQHIEIHGQPTTSGAVLDCGGPNACTGATITGSWIDTIQCVGPQACNQASMDLSQTRGIICSQESCVNGRFILNSNIEGAINCGSFKSCVNSVIEISHIGNINCNGEFACQGAQITVTSPRENFQLDCNGPNACENLELTLVIPASTFTCSSPKMIEWKGITCGSNGGCEGMKLTIVNNGCDIIRMEELTCDTGRACSGAIFNFNAGNSITGGVELTSCMCGPSCRDATGIDLCYKNIKTLECVDPQSCAIQQRSIYNPSNDFLLLCAQTESCHQFKLDIIIAGGSQNLIRRFAGFDCGAERACKEAVISIQNQQLTSSGEAVIVNVGDIICSEKESCNGAVFITGYNVEIQRVMCAPGACKDCLIKRNENDIGIACGPDTTTPMPIVPTTTIVATTTTTVAPPLLPPMDVPVVIPPVVDTPPNVAGSSTTTITPVNAPPIEAPPVAGSTTTTTSTTQTPNIPFVPLIIPNTPIEIPNTNNNGGIPPIPNIPELPIPNKAVPDPTVIV